jgi:hypothetical protein
LATTWQGNDAVILTKNLKIALPYVFLAWQNFSKNILEKAFSCI